MVVKRGLRLGVAGAEACGIGTEDGRPHTRRVGRGEGVAVGGVERPADLDGVVGESWWAQLRARELKRLGGEE